MRRLALSCALVLALAALALPPAEAQVSALQPGPVQLYLSSLQAPLGAVGSVELLVAAPPQKADDSARNVSTGGVAWYAVPGVEREVTVGALAGNFTVRVTPPGVSPLGVLVTGTVTFEVRKVTANGTEVVLGNTTESLQGLLSTAEARNIQWAFSPANATLLPGETLALNVSGSVTPPLAELTMLYDGTSHPSGFNTTLTPVARGSLQLQAATTSRDSAPGSSPTYVVSVRNLADLQDTVSLNVTGQPADWPVRVTPSQVQVAPGGQASALVTVTVPQGTADGTRHTATLTATSGNGGAPQTLALTTTARPAGTTTPGDRDGDGVSDVEETRYGSNPDDRNSTPETTDSDGDGANNRAEIDAGTDPNDPSDFPGSGGNGGSGPGGAGACVLAPLCTSVGDALGVSSATSDLISGGLILLFLIILLLLLLLLFGGYPVKVTLIEPRAVTEPGRSADYTVEVKSRLGRAQNVDLEVADLPSDWEVRFNKPRLDLQAKATETVGLLVRPPGNWPAPSKREFLVRARSRLKPGKFAKAAARLLVQPAPAAALAPPVEQAVPEPAAFPEEEPPGPPPPPPPPALPGAPVFRVRIAEVKHNPSVPERGSEVTTTSRVHNEGPGQERLRVLLVVNGKVRDEVTTELQPGEGAEAEFHWVAYLARNEVKVVAERA